jgi:hypothetical protein
MSICEITVSVVCGCLLLSILIPAALMAEHWMEDAGNRVVDGMMWRGSRLIDGESIAKFNWISGRRDSFPPPRPKSTYWNETAFAVFGLNSAAKASAR